MNDPFSVLIFESYVVGRCKQINEYWKQLAYKDGIKKGYEDGYGKGIKDGMLFAELINHGVPQDEAVKQVFGYRVKEGAENGESQEGKD